MSSLENVSFERGDVVFTEGDAVESSPFMYVLGRGKVCSADPGSGVLVPPATCPKGLPHYDVFL